MDGDEPYKAEWTDKKRVLYDLVVEKPTAWGRTKTIARGLWGVLREAGSAWRRRRAAKAAEAASCPAP